jgi:hypothetical protein
MKSHVGLRLACAGQDVTLPRMEAGQAYSKLKDEQC